MNISYSDVEKTILDVKEDKRKECFNWGKDNKFPSLIEALIESSVTAKSCVDKVAKAIYGGAFGDAGKTIINSDGESINDVWRIAAREYAKHNNVFLQVGYNANLKKKSLSVLPTTCERIGKSDDSGYSGKILAYSNWDGAEGGKIEADKATKIDKYNSDEAVLKAQIEAAGDITDYNGQIIHIKKDSSAVYALSDGNVVLSDMLMEQNSQVFRSRGASRGFLNTKVIVTNPFKDDTDRKAFKKTLGELRGAEHSGEVVLLEAAEQSEDLSKQFGMSDLSSPYNDKLFAYSDVQAEKSICKAWAVPLVLVNPSDSGLFGNSGALLREAQLQLYNDKKVERNQLSEVFNDVLKGFADPVSNLEVIDPFAKEEVEEEAKDVNAEAQATLRGSVGGVTALLQIQQSVSQGTTTKESGISMIVNIYGFNEETAAEILGNPEPVNTVKKETI